jgi:predicted nucleotidyltransferase
MGTKKNSLPEALFSKTQRGVIGLLFGNPQHSFYANEIVRHAQAGIGTVQRELERLTAAGLLTVTRIGNQKHYQANRAAPIFNELEAIVMKTMPPLSMRSAAERIPQALSETRAQYDVRGNTASYDVPKRGLASFCRRHHIKRLGIFGSAARGEAGDTSDVDLLVEFKPDASTSLFDMVRMQDELSRLFGRKVDLATATVLENPYRRRTILKDLRELYAA